MTNGADPRGPARIGAEAGAFFPSTGKGSRPCGDVHHNLQAKRKTAVLRAGSLRADYSLEQGGLKVLLATRPRALLRST